MIPHGTAQRNRQRTPIYLSGNARPIGYVDGEVFIKTIAGSSHMLRRPAAIAFDLATLDAAEDAGATHVAVADRETGKTYRASIADIRRCGFPVARGHGRQIALTLDRYSIDGQRPDAERRAADNNKERAALQMGLFGGAA